MSVAEWKLDWVSGPAGDLHAMDVEPVRSVRVHEVTRSAVVLGSVQSEQDLAAAMATEMREVDVVRRRSGGGAVWLSPGSQLWVDLVIPSGDPLWLDDVGHAAHWVGRVWAAALGSFAASDPPGASDGGEDRPGPEVWTGAVAGRELGRVACFAGLGPGEVTVGGRKLVGVSQRRTRHLARFQCVVYRRWDPEPLLTCLGASEGGRGSLAQVLRHGVSDLEALVPGGPGPTGGPTWVSPAGDRAAGPGGAQWGVVEQLLARLP